MDIESSSRIRWCISLLSHALVPSRDNCFVFSRNVNGLGSKEREIASLKRQLDAAEEEVTEAGRGREVALRENRRLQDDLATMTRENQVFCSFLFGAVPCVREIDPVVS